MSRSNGKYAQFISDRSGMAFPYKEMVVEWNGSSISHAQAWLFAIQNSMYFRKKKQI